MIGDLGELMKLASRAKEIKSGMEQFRSELPKMEFSASGRGVKVTVSGDFAIRSVEIDAAADPQVLAAEITTAANSALAAAKMTIQERMRELTGGIDMPGLF